MRWLLLTGAVLAACANVTPEVKTVHDVTSPSGESSTYSNTVWSSRRPSTVVLDPNEGLAASETGFRIVRRVPANEAMVEDVEGEHRWTAPFISVGLAMNAPLKPGDTVYVCPGCKPSVAQARAATWQLKKVERVDALVGRVIVTGGLSVDPASEVLLPTP